MLFRVSYSFIGANNVLRSSALIIDAKDVNEASRKAEVQLKTEHIGEYRLGKIAPWGKTA